MLKLILILFIGLSNLPKTTPCVVQYDQCGGVYYTGSTECCTLSTCVYSNPWYSQCIPSSDPSTTGCSAVWGQCGGISWNGLTTCCDGSTCIVSNDYYSQCLPTSSSTSSTVSTTTQSSSTTSSSSSSTASTTTQSSSTTSSTSSTTSSSMNQGCSAVWGQCGGIEWNGPTTCCDGPICTFGNAYYSQCIPPDASSSSSSSSSSSTSSTITTTTVSTGNANRQAGTTTRYWDCCKASCGWPGKASVTSPVQTCAPNGTTIVDPNTQSGCTGGSGYMCNNQQPWIISSTLSYGYAAADISGQGESNWCCACYSLIFTSGLVIGKELIVQITNTGGDLGNNQFDLQMPGGGVGIFDGCSSQFPGSYSWGQRYGGVNQRENCANLPDVLQAGCYWRFDWFMNADNPTVSFAQVTCPSALTDNTQCIRL